MYINSRVHVVDLDPTWCTNLQFVVQLQLATALCLSWYQTTIDGWQIHALQCLQYCMWTPSCNHAVDKNLMVEEYNVDTLHALPLLAAPVGPVQWALQVLNTSYLTDENIRLYVKYIKKISPFGAPYVFSWCGGAFISAVVRMRESCITLKPTWGNKSGVATVRTAAWT